MDKLNTDSSESPQLNVITKEQNLLLEIIENHPDSNLTNTYLKRFRQSVNTTDIPESNRVHNNLLIRHPNISQTYNLKDILNRFPDQHTKKVTIQDLQNEITF